MLPRISETRKAPHSAGLEGSCSPKSSQAMTNSGRRWTRKVPISASDSTKMRSCMSSGRVISTAICPWRIMKPKKKMVRLSIRGASRRASRM